MTPTRLRQHGLALSAVALSLFTNLPANATGMVPDTSIVLIDAAIGEGSIDVANSDKSVALLYVHVEDLPEDTEELVIVTAPISRVEPGEKQRVRFIVQAAAPITTQRMKRVTFEGIPQADGGKNTVSINVRQNLPLIINPQGLASKSDPWTLLKWTAKGRELIVNNDSRYVVRLNEQLELLPEKLPLSLSRTYLLPGETYHLELPAGKEVTARNKVRIYPASLYGAQVEPYDAPLTF
ncbi:fimbria/pilus periplasmic chaperone [Pseudomonas sp. AA27]|uniref:fimbria/pilus chaperone family protein n=1 Tax=unclassified Pseudomonas TaxID=196821 RepID=UPI0019408C1C|nr:MULTISPECIES: fimbria/pilus chaperone family protein [unclassified Pseudomonas]MCF1486425.1 fimbria/pilus periplasmic chaperone [Pseudomonas sp. AA27]BCJ06157.1 fimbrial protein [Pseudomonas sp. RtIB026]